MSAASGSDPSQLLHAPDASASPKTTHRLFNKLFGWIGKLSRPQRVSLFVSVLTLLVLPSAFFIAQQPFKVRSRATASMPATVPGTSGTPIPTAEPDCQKSEPSGLAQPTSVILPEGTGGKLKIFWTPPTSWGNGCPSFNGYSVTITTNKNLVETSGFLSGQNTTQWNSKYLFSGAAIVSYKISASNNGGQTYPISAESQIYIPIRYPTPTPSRAVTPTPTQTVTSPVNWTTPYVQLLADDFYFIVNGKRFNGRNARYNIKSSPPYMSNGITSTTLEVEWTENNAEMRFFVYFKSDGKDWWTNEIRTYNGDSPRGDWIFYPPEAYNQQNLPRIITKPIGSSYGGNFTKNGAGYGKTGTVYFKNLRLRAFTGVRIATPTPTRIPTPTKVITPTNPKSPTIPPNRTPVIETTKMQVGTQGIGYAHPIYAYDFDLNDKLSISLSGLPTSFYVVRPCETSVQTLSNGTKRQLMRCGVRGSPQVAGTYTLQMTAMDGKGAVVVKSLPLVINPSTNVTPTPTPTRAPTPTPTQVPAPTSSTAKPVVITNSIPSGTRNSSYLANIQAYDVDSSQMLNITFSNLPIGLQRLPQCTYNYKYIWPFTIQRVTTCYIYGMLSTAGTFTIRATVRDNQGGVTVKDYPLIVR